MDGRLVVTEISSFQINWCHLICGTKGAFDTTKKSESGFGFSGFLHGHRGATLQSLAMTASSRDSVALGVFTSDLHSAGMK